MVFSRGFFVAVIVASAVLQAFGFDNTRSDNLAVYWGQNSYGATHTSDTANWQQTLSYYCQDNTINAIPMAFLDVFFSTGGLPEINMANSCSSVGGVFAGTNLANCQSLATDIQACQAKGKIITLSLGGATGASTFTSDAQAQTFADTIWNLFLGGSSSTRPFGAAVLDGIDLDIEGGSSTGFAAFVTRIRSHASGASKPYYITAAPQCPFPDAYLGSVINAVGFDAVYVQILISVSICVVFCLRMILIFMNSFVYNNYCGVNSYSNPNDWDFSTWDNWAKVTSPNKNVKVYIGAPASSTAAGSGYVDATTLGNIAQQTRSQYSSFGGIMLWDASQAYANGRYDVAIKNAMGAGTGTTIGTSTTKTSTTTSKTTSTTTSKTTTTTTSIAGTGSCAGVAAWISTVAYVGGQQVTYGGHLWTAKWWTEADTPGGSAGVWTDNGACTSSRIATANPVVTAVKETNSAVSVASALPSVKTDTVKISGSSAAVKATVSNDVPQATKSATVKNGRRYSRMFKD